VQRGWISRLAVPAATLAAALAAIVLAGPPGADAVDRGREGFSPRANRADGADGPPRVVRPERLRPAGGRIWWSEPDCGTTVFAVSSLARRAFPQAACRVWPDPRGDRALASGGTWTALLVDRRLGIVRAGGRRAGWVSHRVGYVVTPPVWRRDGLRVAYCLRTRDGEAVAVADGPGEAAVHRGECFPVWLPDGRLATVRTGRLDLGARTIPLARLTAAAELPLSRPVATGVGEAGGLLALGLAARTELGRTVGPAGVVIVDLRGRLRASVMLPGGRVPATVGVSPDGAAGWYYDRDGREARLFWAGGRDGLPANVPRRARAYAWSPDGRHVAVALADGIHVYDWYGPQESVIRGVLATGLAWTL
jgi:hypothetical protein